MTCAPPPALSAPAARARLASAVLARRGCTLPPPELRILGLLLVNVGRVVSRDAAAEMAADDPADPWTDNRLDLAISNIRGCVRAARLNIHITTKRAAGWQLDVSAPGAL